MASKIVAKASFLNVQAFKRVIYTRVQILITEKCLHIAEILNLNDVETAGKKWNKLQNTLGRPLKGRNIPGCSGAISLHLILEYFLV